MPFSRKTVLKLVTQCLVDLGRDDTHLLEVGANERAITHKLGEYLRDHFEASYQDRRPSLGLSVDCEYNRIGMLGGPKKLPLEREVPLKYPQRKEVKYYTPNPDIILHGRGDQAQNMLVIEVKACGNDGEGEVLLDRMKLAGYLGEPTDYYFGMFLNLDIDRDKNNLVVREAVLADLEVMKLRPKARQESEWDKAIALLLKDPDKGNRATLKKLDAAAHSLAGDRIEDFDEAYGFTDVTELLSDLLHKYGKWLPGAKMIIPSV